MTKFQMSLLLGGPVLLMTAVLAYAQRYEKGSGPLTGDYMFYSGTLKNQGAANMSDAKLSVAFSEQMASEIYRYMGASSQIKDSCGILDRREKGDIGCVRNRKTGQVSCQVNLDLKTGKASLVLGC